MKFINIHFFIWYYICIIFIYIINTYLVFFYNKLNNIISFLFRYLSISFHTVLPINLDFLLFKPLWLIVISKYLLTVFLLKLLLELSLYGLDLLFSLLSTLYKIIFHYGFLFYAIIFILFYLKHLAHTFVHITLYINFFSLLILFIVFSFYIYSQIFERSLFL